MSKGGYFSLDEQIELFNATVNYALSRIIQDITKLEEHLSKCIFLFSVGSNDYIQNYLQSGMGSYYNDNSEEYADYLLEKLASHVKVKILFERLMLVYMRFILWVDILTVLRLGDLIVTF